MEQITKLKAKGRKQVKKVTVITKPSQIIERLLRLMKQHIGVNNRIARYYLFKSVYDLSPDEVSPLQQWIMWQMVKQSMNRMRRETLCFIVSKQMPLMLGERQILVWNYWVAKTNEDYQVYKDHIDNNIKKMKELEERCRLSVAYGWYKRDWKVG